MENVIKLIRNNEECTQTQLSLASIDASLSKGTFDVLNFCNEKGIDTSNFLATARLFQVADVLNDFWNMCVGNGEDMNELRNPDVLYKKCVSYIKSTGGK